MTPVLHLQVGSISSRCGRQGMRSNNPVPATVSVTTNITKVTCKDCLRLARFDAQSNAESAARNGGDPALQTQGAESHDQ